MGTLREEDGKEVFGLSEVGSVGVPRSVLVSFSYLMSYLIRRGHSILMVGSRANSDTHGLQDALFSGEGEFHLYGFVHVRQNMIIFVVQPFTEADHLTHLSG